MSLYNPLPGGKTIPTFKVQLASIQPLRPPLTSGPTTSILHYPLFLRLSRNS